MAGAFRLTPALRLPDKAGEEVLPPGAGMPVPMGGNIELPPRAGTARAGTAAELQPPGAGIVVPMGGNIELPPRPGTARAGTAAEL